MSIPEWAQGLRSRVVAGRGGPEQLWEVAFIHNGEWIADMSVMPESTVREMVSAAMRLEGDHREKLSPSLAIHTID